MVEMPTVVVQPLPAGTDQVNLPSAVFRRLWQPLLAPHRWRLVHRPSVCRPDSNCSVTLSLAKLSIIITFCRTSCQIPYQGELCLHTG